MDDCDSSNIIKLAQNIKKYKIVEGAGIRGAFV